MFTPLPKPVATSKRRIVRHDGNYEVRVTRTLAAFGIAYTPSRGLLGGVELSYTGSSLDKRNRVLAGGFANLGVGLGYRTPRWELRADVSNLTDRRGPVAESELGDAQYYLLPSRRVEAGLRIRF
jgi:outer membrane receptor protein involved in Fe transport